MTLKERLSIAEKALEKEVNKPAGTRSRSRVTKLEADVQRLEDLCIADETDDSGILKLVQLQADVEMMTSNKRYAYGRSIQAMSKLNITDDMLKQADKVDAMYDKAEDKAIEREATLQMTKAMFNRFKM